jgi:hypothetical protein
MVVLYSLQPTTGLTVVAVVEVTTVAAEAGVVVTTLAVVEVVHHLLEVTHRFHTERVIQEMVKL